jgi:hypothetical protein
LALLTCWFLICRVGRVTECGGEVGRLNVVGGAEVALCLFTHSKVFHLIYAAGSQKMIHFLKNNKHVFFIFYVFSEIFNIFFVKVSSAMVRAVSWSYRVTYVRIFG